MPTLKSNHVVGGVAILGGLALVWWGWKSVKG